MGQESLVRHARAILLSSIFAFILALDQLTKLWAIHYQAGKPPRWYFGILQLTYAENAGGWGSLGANWSDHARWIALLVVPGAVLLFLAIYALREKELDWYQASGYTLVISGGLGNLIDRYRYQHVVDMLYIGYGPVGTNIFNVADMAVLLGIFLLLYGSWKEGKEAVAEQPDGEIQA